ncbi:hypothetical protein Lser_V15G13101 [Lactuca serriola]
MALPVLLLFRFWYVKPRSHASILIDSYDISWVQTIQLVQRFIQPSRLKRFYRLHFFRRTTKRSERPGAGTRVELIQFAFIEFTNYGGKKCIEYCLNYAWYYPVRDNSQLGVCINSLVPNYSRFSEKWYELILSLGRGVVYLGSARMGPGYEHYVQTQELAREASCKVVRMHFMVRGWTRVDGCCNSGCYWSLGSRFLKKQGNGQQPVFIRIFLLMLTLHAGKHGLMDATVRSSKGEKTGLIVLLGGIGTLDEAFDILPLIQFKRIGFALPVPFVLMNYDSIYSKLL